MPYNNNDQQNTGAMPMFSAIQTNESVWKLGQAPSDDATEFIPEEVVASFQGVLCNLDLPPFKQRLRYA